MGTQKLLTAGGGGVKLTPKSSISSDVTVNIPSVNGDLVNTGSTAQVSQAMLASGVAGNGPAFSAYLSSNQSIAGNTWTKITFQTEEFDTASCFNNSSTYRFTPNVAGYYQVNAAAWMGGQASQAIAIYKNGSQVKRGNQTSGGGYLTMTTIAALIYLNGTTDYIEIYGYQNSGSQTILAQSDITYFQAFLARSA